MKHLFHWLVSLGFAAFLFPILSSAQSAPVRRGAVHVLMVHRDVRQVKLSHFELQSSAVITSPGDSLSSPQYHSANYWYPVTVPSTVLTGLVDISPAAIVLP